MHDTIIIGGGIVGLGTAYVLVCGGADTLLIDRDDPGQASDAGAGILSGGVTDSGDSGSRYDLSVRAFKYYESLIDRLRADQAGNDGYTRCGLMVVAVSEDEIEPLTSLRASIEMRGEGRGVAGEADVRTLSSDEARAMFPPLAAVHGAVYSSRGARVDGRCMSRSLRRGARRHGLRTMSAGVDSLVLENGRAAGVVVDGETIRGRHVVIAGGAWSGAFGEQLGVQIPVAPQRGQIIHLGLADTDTRAWPIVSAFHEHYMVPWPDSRVAVGATRETGSGFGTHVTAAGVREVLDEALRVAPGLRDAEIREIRVGLRPLAADELPILGSVTGIGNVFLVTGHGPSGLQLGPYSGKLVADMILGNEPEMDISEFGVGRFG